MRLDNSLTLPDGRTLAYAEYGDPDGHPVMYFHGSPSSRLEPLLLGDDAFSRLGLRMIAPDRPGMGRSDFQPDRGFSDWPEDVVFLADTIGLKQFAVLGISGGGGYAAACAAKIPERLDAVVIASGAWRMDWPEAKDNLHFPNSLIWSLARNAPFMLRAMLKMMRVPPDARREQILAQQKKSLPAPDYAVLELPGRLDAYLHMLNEAMHQGVRGPDWDMRLYVHEWDFDPNEIQVPLTLFHGRQDMNVPLAVVQRAIRMLPSAQLVTYENEGHLSTFSNHLDEIARALVCD